MSTFGWYFQENLGAHGTWLLGWYTPSPPAQGGIKVTKYNPPVNPVSIIGIQPGTAVLIHTESNAAGAGVSFAQTIFDTTTRADSARILLTNSTGATGYVRGAAINAKVVTMISGPEGFINDRYVDYESIASNGELKYELGNNFIVTIDQVNKLADYAWKNNRTKRHIYTLSLLGMHTFFEPGEWYTITVGQAGSAENLSVVCECYSVRSSLTADDIGQTSVDFREVYQNWTFDSNELARSIASGQFGRFPEHYTVMVASSTYLGTADYYCDGTADDVEVNNAVTYMNTRGGGNVQLTEGSFNLATSITMAGSVSLIGFGAGTVISTPSALTYSIQVVASSAAHLSSIGIRDLKISAASTLGAIYATFVDGLTISKVTSNSYINLDTCNGVLISECILENRTGNDSPALIGVTASPMANIINNILRNATGAGGGGGIDLASSSDSSIVNCNNIYNLSTGNATKEIYGIISQANRSTISSNRVEDVKNTADETKAWGINIFAGSNNSVVGNYCYNNGNDTGIANTNKSNFVDGGTDTQVG